MNEVPRTSELGSTPRPGVVRRKYCWVSARTAKRGQVSNFAVFLRNSLPVPGLPLADHTLPDPLHGLYEQLVRGKHSVVEYEPDSELRDTEQVPLLETGGVEAFFRREVLPHVPDAWIGPDSTKIGDEISFTRYFYPPKPLRTLERFALISSQCRRKRGACWTSYSKDRRSERREPCPPARSP
jgi:hypothetical protein